MTHPLNIAAEYLFGKNAHLAQNVSSSLYIFVIDTRTETINFVHTDNDWEIFYFDENRQNTEKHETEYIRHNLKQAFCQSAKIMGTTAFVSDKIAFPLALELKMAKTNTPPENFFNLSAETREVELVKEEFPTQIRRLGAVELYRKS